MKNDYPYDLSDLEKKILLAIAKQENFLPTPYAKASDGKTNMHMFTLDARRATRAVSDLLKELNIIE